MNDPSNGTSVSATDRLEEALAPLPELPHDLVPEAGGSDIVIYDGERRDLRYQAIEQGSQSALGFLVCVIFLFGVLSTAPGLFGTLLVSLLGATGGAFGLVRGVECGHTLLQLRKQEPQLFLPEGVAEDEARFENHSRLTIGAWNDEAVRWNIDAGDLKSRYRDWAARTFRAERLKEGLTPTEALKEYATLRRESERLAQPGGDPKGRAARVRELRDLTAQWIEKTFDPKAIEDGLSPEQVRIEYEAFAREADALASARTETEARGNKIRSKLEGFGQRLDTGKVPLLLPDVSDEPETVIDADDLPKRTKNDE